MRSSTGSDSGIISEMLKTKSVLQNRDPMLLALVLLLWHVSSPIECVYQDRHC